VIFFDFQDGDWTPSWNFKIAKLYLLRGYVGWGTSLSHIWSKSVNPLRRYWDFSFYQGGGRPPSWICFRHIWTNLRQYLVHVVYHCAKFGYDQCRNLLIFGVFGWKAPINGPQNGVLGAIWPHKWGSISTYQRQRQLESAQGWIAQPAAAGKCRDIEFYVFQNDAWMPSWILIIGISKQLVSNGGLIRVILQNFVKISQTILGISQFFDFQYGRRPLCRISNFWSHVRSGGQIYIAIPN